MADSREGSEAWSYGQISSKDVQSLNNSMEELSGHESGVHSRQPSDDCVTSPLRREGGLDRPPGEQMDAVRTQQTESDAAQAARLKVPASSTAPARQPEDPDSSSNSRAQQAGGSWWSSISDSVRKVAEVVAKDIDELQENLQNMLNEVGDDDAEEEDEAPNSRNPAQHEAPDSPKTAARRQEILARLEGDDTELEAGLKAIDEQVEQLTGGLSRAIGSLWGTAREAVSTGVSFSQRVAERMEEAAQEMSSHMEASVKRAAEGVGPDRHAGAAEPTFQRHWHDCGGQQSFEEIEALSNECARLCNRIRTRLPPEARIRLEDALTRLGPCFDVQTNLQSSPERSIMETSSKGDALSQGHAAVAELRDAGIKTAAIIVELTEEASSSRQNEPTSAQEQATDEEGAAAKLKGVYAEGVRLLAELCGLCVERLHALGRSLSAQIRYKRPADDGILWPTSAQEKAELLHAQAKEMLGDLESLAEAFVDSIGQVADALVAEAPTRKTALVRLADSLSSSLELTCSTAANRLQESLRGLLYVVMLSSEELQRQRTESTQS